MSEAVCADVGAACSISSYVCVCVWIIVFGLVTHSPNSPNVSALILIENLQKRKRKFSSLSARCLSFSIKMIIELFFYV